MKKDVSLKYIAWLTVILIGTMLRVQPTHAAPFTIPQDTTVDANDRTYVPAAITVDPELAANLAVVGHINTLIINAGTNTFWPGTSAPSANSFFLFAIYPPLEMAGLQVADTTGIQLGNSTGITPGNTSFPNAVDLQRVPSLAYTNNDRNSTRIYWTGRNLVDQPGDDFVVAEQGTSDEPELFFVRAKLLNGLFTEWRYQTTDAFLDQAPTGGGTPDAGQFLTAYNLTDFTLVNGNPFPTEGRVDFIEIINGTANTRTGLSPDASFPDVSMTSFADDKLDADIAYVLPVNAANLAAYTTTPVTAGTGFPSIQSAIDAPGTAAGETISVANGTYTENVHVTKDVTINGNGATIIPAINTTTDCFPANTVPGHFLDDATCAIFMLDTSGATVNNFLIDGDNPNLSGGVLVNGVDVNTTSGINSANRQANNNLTVQNNTIQNLQFGFLGFATRNEPATGAQITGNTITNISSRAINMVDTFYASATNNTITQAVYGVQTNNFYLNGSPATISNNYIEAVIGIFHNNHYQQAASWTIDNNTVTHPTQGAYGILASSIQDAVTATFTGNTVSNMIRGMYAFNITGGATFTDTQISNVDNGVVLSDILSVFSARTDVPHTLTITNMTIDNPALAGLRVTNNAAPAGALLNLNATGVIVNGSGVGDGLLMEDFDGNTAEVNVTNSIFQNLGSTTGLDIQGGNLADSSVTQSCIVNNGAGATAYAGTFNATENWWGAVNGPSGAGPGSGDTVDGNINFANFLTAPPTIRGITCPAVGVVPTPTPPPPPPPPGDTGGGADTGVDFDGDGVVEVQELPATGEGPFWRIPLLAGAALLLMALAGMFIRRRTANH